MLLYYGTNLHRFKREMACVMAVFMHVLGIGGKEYEMNFYKVLAVGHKQTFYNYYTFSRTISCSHRSWI